MRLSFEASDIYVGDGGVQWNPALPTLVFVHGAGLDHTVWVLLARYFARHGFNVVTPDLPGHGASGGNLITSIEGNAQWLNRFVQHVCKEHQLQASGLLYAGHSMGSLVAMEAAAQNPDMLAKLVLLGTATPMAVGAPLLDAARANEHAAIDMINFFGHSYGSRIGNNPISGINIYNVSEALLERAGDGVLYNDLNACNEYAGGDAAAARLAGEVSTTVIAGDSDRMTPVKMSRRAQELLGAQFELLDDCGHMMMSEAPEATLQALKRALA